MPGITLLRRVVLTSLAVTLLSTRPAEARMPSEDPALRVMDLAGERRFALSLGPVRIHAGGRARTGDAIARATRVSRAALLYRFTAVVCDSAGEPLAQPLEWRLDVLVRSADAAGSPVVRSLARLDASSSLVQLPKPLGYDLHEGDSLVIVAIVDDVATPIAGPVVLHLTIDYEPIEAPLSRLAVVPLHLGEPTRGSLADDGDAEDPDLRQWEWRQQAPGRLLAIAGTALDGARELRLEDVGTGVVLWRRTIPPDGPDRDHARTRECLRLGVVLEQGRWYRLTVRVVHAQTLAATSRARTDLLHAMMLPNRP